MRPLITVAVVVGGCVLAGAFSPAKSQPDRLPDSAAPPAKGESPHAPYGVGTVPFEHRPATSCAAASCHGGGHVGKIGSEYSTWAPEVFPQGGSGDPHNKAYRILFNPVSVEMAKKLKLGEAHKAALCLKCHAVESQTEPDTRDQILAEGVGCSGCHGPADKWVSQHYLPEWQTLSNREKWEKYGFVPTKNLVARTLNCASCHVGDGDQDVNHDLYAAGHPRITFESAAFHNQQGYRKHWVEKTPQPDFEVRAWVVGQAAALRSATELVRARAERTLADKPNSPWPEFAGYSCYACHQKVGEESIRGTASISPRPAGVAGWEVWSNTGVGIAAEYCGEAFSGLSSPDLTEVKKLRELMELPRPPAPAKVKEQATKALAELDAWLAAMQAAEDAGPKPVQSGTAEKIAHALARNALARDKKGEPLLADHDWDALAANYLGCAAMYHATGATADKWQPPLAAIRNNLKFPEPKSGRFDSPADLTRDKLLRLRDNFELLREATQYEGAKR